MAYRLAERCGVPVDDLLESWTSEDLEEFGQYLLLKQETEKQAIDEARLEQQAEAAMNKGL